jgi:hypothetical protein
LIRSLEDLKQRFTKLIWDRDSSRLEQVPTELQATGGTCGLVTDFWKNTEEFSATSRDTKTQK